MGAPSQDERFVSRFAALMERHVAEVESGNMEGARASMDAVMAAVLEEAESNPSPDVFRGLLIDRAVDSGEWGVARRMYEEDLNAARAETDVNVKASWEAGALLHLAGIEAWQDHMDSAYQLACEAVSAARTSEWDFTLVHFLEPFAGIALQAGRVEEAIRAADEGLSRLEDRRMNDHFRAMLLLRKAEGLLRLQQHEQVCSILDDVWKLVSPMAVMEEAWGIQATLGKWWRLQARMLTAIGDSAGACRAWETSVDRCRKVAEAFDGVRRSCNATLAESLAGLADALESAGDSRRAAQLREERTNLSRVNPGLV
jgi:hypothetical protein